jgi:hypothetical protein
MSDIFGPLIDNTDVESAVSKTVEYWIDVYLAAKERAKGWSVQTLARPASYNATYDYDNWPEGQLPGIAVVCHGTIEDPAYHHQAVSAWFEVDVDVIVTDQSEATARAGASAYVSALATLITQQAGLCGSGDVAFASDARFVAWDLKLPDVDNRTLAVGTTQFHVLVSDIFDPSAGPLALSDPSHSDPGQFPTVANTDIRFDADSVTGPLD